MLIRGPYRRWGWNQEGEATNVSLRSTCEIRLGIGLETSYVQHQSEVHPGYGAGDVTREKLSTTSSRGPSRRQGWGQATSTMVPRSIQKAGLETSYSKGQPSSGLGQKGAGKVPGATKTSYHPQNLPRGCCEVCPSPGRSRLLLEVTPCPEKPNRYCTGPFFAPS